MSWTDHLNGLGMITQKQGDDCDQAQREGMFAMNMAIREKHGMPIPEVIGKLRPALAARLLEVDDKPGDYKRTGNKDSRCHRPDMLTRDQSTGITALLLVLDSKKRLSKFFRNMLFRGFFTNNKTGHRNTDKPELHGKSRRDFFGLDQIANCIRGLGGIYYLLYPLVLLGDLSLLYSTIKVKKYDKKDDVLNYVLRLVISKAYFNTVMGRICAKIADPEDLYRRLHIYFSRQSPNGDHGPPMHELYSVVFLNKVLKDK